MSKKKCCKSKKPCKDCPRNKKKKIGAIGLGTADAEDKSWKILAWSRCFDQ